MIADPTNAEALTLLGRAYVLLGRGQTGRFFLQRAVELDPNYARGHFFLAIFLLAAGEKEQALFHLNEVIALAPGTMEAEKASDLMVQYSK